MKIPLGDLIKEEDVNKENILSKISSESIVITVGDKTTENMIRAFRDKVSDVLRERTPVTLPSDKSVLIRPILEL